MESVIAKALGQDVSQLDLDQKRALLTRLLARFAHEIRNPLGSLRIHVQLLEEDLDHEPGPLRGDYRDRLEILYSELHQLETIVNNLANLASPKEIEPVEGDLREVLRQAHSLLLPEARNRGMRFALRLPRHECPARFDPTQLQQALINLVINAIQALDHGGRIRLHLGGNAGKGWAIVVADDGPGVAEENLPNLFEPYFTTKPDGSGIGLWIVQQIAAAHGGRARAGNRPRRGARFVIELPPAPART